MTMEIKPRLRGNSVRASFRSHITDAVFMNIESKVSEKNFPFQNCIMCDHFDQKTEICRLAKQRPPARVIAFGCSSFVDEDYIPF